jgi:hypothetical protein
MKDLILMRHRKCLELFFDEISDNLDEKWTFKSILSVIVTIDFHRRKERKKWNIMN